MHGVPKQTLDIRNRSFTIRVYASIKHGKPIILHNAYTWYVTSDSILSLQASLVAGSTVGSESWRGRKAKSEFFMPYSSFRLAGFLARSSQEDKNPNSSDLFCTIQVSYNCTLSGCRVLKRGCRPLLLNLISWDFRWKMNGIYWSALFYYTTFH